VNEPVGVIGAGAWGTTLAIRLAASGHGVTLWAHTAEARRDLAAQRANVRYLPGIPIPDSVRLADDESGLAEPHRLFILAVPSAHTRATLQRLAQDLYPATPILSAVKGIEETTHLRISQVIAEELPGREIAVLSGPNLAREIAAGKPAGSVVASDHPDLNAELTALLGSDRFRVYTNSDVVGVELCGALKNVVALAAGMVDGLRLGDSAKAGIITRGLAEMTRLGVAAGANPMTFAGLAGVGDLIATCMSTLSRNRQAGELLGQGEAWTDVAPQLRGIAEGVTTVHGALALAVDYGVELPIAAQVAAVISRSVSPVEAVGALMRREPKDELAGLSS
jgi:glycerol-3-phosphate dehydrogenase (NAD(P)+)